MCEDLYDGMTSDDYDFATFVIAKANDLVKSKNERLVRDTETLKESQRRSAEQIRDLKKQLAGLPQIEKEAYKKAVKDMFHGFHVGQTVWVVGTNYTYTPCTACSDGKAIISLNREEMIIRCPKCDGKGRITTSGRIPNEKKIESISFRQSSRSSQVVTFIEIYLNDDCRYNIDNVYHTKEDCQVEVDRKNKE